MGERGVGVDVHPVPVVHPFFVLGLDFVYPFPTFLIPLALGGVEMGRHGGVGVGGGWRSVVVCSLTIIPHVFRPLSVHPLPISPILSDPHLLPSWPTDQPPPDHIPQPNTTTTKPKRPWFNRDPSSFFTGASPTGSGYQSGGSTHRSFSPLPSFMIERSRLNTETQSYASVGPTPGPSSYSSHANTGGPNRAAEDAGTANSWETRFGWRVDVEAAGAYLLGPLTGSCFSSFRFVSKKRKLI